MCVVYMVGDAVLLVPFYRDALKKEKTKGGERSSTQK